MNQIFYVIAFLFLISCSNNPYGEFPPGHVVLTYMGGDPKTLDPVRVGDTSSNGIASNIHDTPYEYHYLKRPLQLIPSMATGMPLLSNRTFGGKKFQTFRFSIKKNLRYMDDACFKDGKGREIKIDDIIFSIKRAADTSINPFGYPLLAGKVQGFDEYSEMISQKRMKLKEHPDQLNEVNLFDENVPGVTKIDDYTLELLLTEDYPQIIYFFSLTISSPVPPECLSYYNGKNGRPLYDRHPASSGAFYLKEWHANHRIVLVKNPNYRSDDFYPSEGNPGDDTLGLLDLAGRRLPLVDEIRFQIIQAGPPVWTLFEQGYLDRAGIPSEVFNQVIRGNDLSQKYVDMGIRLDKTIDVSTYWFYFNMKDPLFERNKDLRHALSLCLDRDEMIERFYNNRGKPAHSIIPPGLEGYSDDFINPYTAFDPERAMKLLAKAGYPGGIDKKTGRPLKVELILVASQGATSQYRFYIDQFSKCNIDLQITTLDWPTVLERKYKKNFQMIHGGWHADYPDPQNFLQLLYGPNIESSYNENSYINPEFDSLYSRIKNMKPGPERERIIYRMNEITAEDSPMLFLFHPVSFGLSHQWFAPMRPHPINTNQLKYRYIDPELRKEKAAFWNRPGLIAYSIPLGAAILVIFLVYLTVRGYKRMDS